MSSRGDGVKVTKSKMLSMPNDTVEPHYNDQHHDLCIKEAAFFAGRD